MNNHDLLAGIIPAGVFWQIADPWMWDKPVCDAEESLISRAVEKRKREFRAGRNCSHALFKQHQVNCLALLRGTQREPAWPAGWIGSISHTEGLCAVAIAPKSKFISVGLDVEQSSPLSDDVKNLICIKDELDQLNSINNTYGQNLARTLGKVIFSAKESIHKTYFPLNYHTLDFQDARITLDIDKGTFSADIIRPENAPHYPIKHLVGRFAYSEQFVATCITF